MLGEHVGLSFYTIGQRRGLGVGGVRGQAERPWYVVAKDMATNKLLVSQDESDLFESALIAGGMIGFVRRPKHHFVVTRRSVTAKLIKPAWSSRYP